VRLHQGAQHQAHSNWLLGVAHNQLDQNDQVTALQKVSCLEQQKAVVVQFSTPTVARTVYN
jgi:hypothetical protein